MRKKIHKSIFKVGKEALGFLTLLSLLSLTGCGEEEGILIGQPSEETDSALQESLQVLTSSGESVEQETMVVYVCGAVRFPGLVTLPVGSRAGDALELAGGFAEDADLSWVNLAQIVEDGEKIYFPSAEEGAALLEGEKLQAKALVNLNTAGKQELCTLPGIGESKAEDILSYRKKNGNFHSVRDVMKVPGIKQALFDQIQDKITVE